MGRMRALLGLLLFTTGCGSCARPSAQDAGPERSVPDETVQPVYAASGEPLPEAVRLCRAVHDLPEQRTAACCQRRPGVTFAEHCAGVLSAALRGGALALDPAHLDACTAELERLHAGCEWVGPAGVAMPASCETGLVVGKLGAGKRCRSSLECEGDLRCQGAGPTDPGVCAGARAAGGACRLAVDGLAPLLGLDVDRSHPECQGYCDHHRCQQKVESGGACVSSEQCPAQEHCARKRCVARGEAAAGAACGGGGDCAEGLRCLEGLCRAPKRLGEPCSTATECGGRCARGDGGGVCVMGC